MNEAMPSLANLRTCTRGSFCMTRPCEQKSRPNSLSITILITTATPTRPRAVEAWQTCQPRCRCPTSIKVTSTRPETLPISPGIPGISVPRLLQWPRPQRRTTTGITLWCTGTPRVCMRPPRPVHQAWWSTATPITTTVPVASISIIRGQCPVWRPQWPQRPRRRPQPTARLPVEILTRLALRWITKWRGLRHAPRAGATPTFANSRDVIIRLADISKSCVFLKLKIFEQKTGGFISARYQWYFSPPP